MTDWKYQAGAVSDTVARNGFDGATWANLPAKLMIAVTELDELVDYFYGKGEDPYGEELADFAIRLLCILDNLYGDSWDLREPIWDESHIPGFPLEVVERVVWPLVSRCAKAVEYWRKGDRDDVKIALELVFCETLRAARRLGVDLAAEVEAKDRRNADRPKLHGKSESLG